MPFCFEAMPVTAIFVQWLDVDYFTMKSASLYSCSSLEVCMLHVDMTVGASAFWYSFLFPKRKNILNLSNRTAGSSARAVLSL